MNLNIRQPRLSDFSKIQKLFVESIENTFKLNSIEDELECNFEIIDKTRRVKRYLENVEPIVEFIIAEDSNVICGIAGLYPITKLIRENVKTATLHNFEIGSVYILPQYQRKGIAKKLFCYLIDEMIKQGIKDFYLDCGYTTSQKYWKQLLGEPSLSFENYFNSGDYYMIWKNKTKRVQKMLLSSTI